MNMNLAIFLMLLFTLVTSKDQWFPKFHFAPEKGWMNDPNGLSYFNGYYQLFFQYTPDNPSPSGLKHWGHARSKDMLNWERLPIALKPSIPEDIDGIFSGSAVVDNNNLTLIYTGVSGNHQVQCLATSSDGVTFAKKGVILRKNGTDEDFRDPKAWWQDDAWFVVTGSKFSVNGEDRGEILLYKSKDLYHWESQGRLVDSKSGQGYMWECPDFFTLNNKQILITSPQGIAQNGYDYQNLYQSVYFVGTWTPGSAYNIEKNLREIDHGHDFYAPQTFLAPDGRRIVIGWFGMWESVFPEKVDGWATMMTLPRELTLSTSGDLKVRPIREIFKARKSPFIKMLNFVVNNLIFMEENVVAKEVVIDYDLSKNTSKNFGIRIGDNSTSKIGIHLYVDRTKSRLFLERYYPEYNITASSRSIPINLNESLYLDIFVDGSSIEVFVNDGMAVLSSRIYPNHKERILSLFGKVNINCYKSWSL